MSTVSANCLQNLFLFLPLKRQSAVSNVRRNALGLEILPTNDNFILLSHSTGGQFSASILTNLPAYNQRS